MRRGTVGVLAAIVLGVMLMSGAVAFAESLGWTGSTGWFTLDIPPQTGTFTEMEMATMTYYVRVDKPVPPDMTGRSGLSQPGTWYYIGESRNGVQQWPADNALATLLRSYGLGGQVVKFTVSQAFKGTDNAEIDSLLSAPYSWTVPLVVASMPTFNPSPGSYTTAQNVALSTATAGASIRYTTDLSIPSATAGTLYSAPIPVGVGTTTIKAVAYMAGMADSTQSLGTYVVTLPFQPRTPGAPAGLGIR